MILTRREFGKLTVAAAASQLVGPVDAYAQAHKPNSVISGVQLGTLLGGTVVLETIFAWPGVGRAIFEAIMQRDYPLIQAGVLVLGVIVVVVNLLVDLTYRMLNPRVKLG